MLLILQIYSKSIKGKSDLHSFTNSGIALAKRLVELHGGKIWVESEGQGCTFCFISPCYPPERKRMELPACNLPICG